MAKAPLQVASIAIDVATARAVSGAEDGSLRLWDILGGACSFAVRAHPGPIVSVGFGDAGRTLLSAGEDRQVRVTDPTTGATVGYRHHAGSRRPAGAITVGDAAGNVVFLDCEGITR